MDRHYPASAKDGPDSKQVSVLCSAHSQCVRLARLFVENNNQRHQRSGKAH